MIRFTAAAMLAAAIFIACSGEQTSININISAQFNESYPTYGRLLDSVVVGDLVNYQWLVDNRSLLDTAVARFAGLDSARYSSLSNDARMAMWINAYNAITLRSIVDHYPVASIRDIDGVWDKITWPVAGRDVTLDEIEHKILRPTFEDARIHFAVNCASIGCPPLADDPYMADKLEAQLDSMTSRFVNDPQRTLIDSAAGELAVSRIFDWFSEDFVGSYTVEWETPNLDDKQRAVLGFLIEHGSDSLQAVLTSRNDWTMTFCDYDWSLNDLNE